MVSLTRFVHSAKEPKFQLFRYNINFNGFTKFHYVPQISQSFDTNFHEQIPFEKSRLTLEICLSLLFLSHLLYNDKVSYVTVLELCPV